MRQTRQLGRYHLTYRIAYGGMAELFRAFTFERDGSKHDVAIKQLLPHFHKDREFVDMLTDEFKLVSCIAHVNVARVFELVELENTTLISMEYVDGKDLRSAIERGKELHKQLAIDDAVYIVARSLEGLHHAHLARDKQGHDLSIVHRDYSPANILLGYDGSVKLCDFGVAKASSNRIQTKTGIIKGKVRYMSPEQAFGRKLDARSDLFSVGSVLYELVTGQPAFVAPNDVELIFAVRDAMPIPVAKLNAKLPVELIQIIERAMKRNTEERYESALEFRDDLVAFLRGFAPGYRRTRLSSWMKRLFEQAIEDELRAMEDFVLEIPDRPVEYGRNLLADVQDDSAPQLTWSPVPTQFAKPSSSPFRLRARDEEDTEDQAPAPTATVSDDELEGAPTRVATRVDAARVSQRAEIASSTEQRIPVLFDDEEGTNTDVMPRTVPVHAVVSQQPPRLPSLRPAPLRKK